MSIGRKSFTTAILFQLILGTHHLSAATDAAWNSTSDTDLNTAGNWSPATVPNGIATFDSTSPVGVVATPTANAPFVTDTFAFPNSASAFAFTFAGPGVLGFTGNGITGTTNTDTTITATNDGALSTAQVYFQVPATSPFSPSIGSASITAINGINGTIVPISGDIAQIFLADSFNLGVVPADVSAMNNASVSATNWGTIQTTGAPGRRPAQITLEGASFIASTASNVAFSATNNSLIEAPSGSAQDAGQIALLGYLGTTTLSVGNDATFTLNNQNGGTVEAPFLVAQLLLNALTSHQTTLSAGDSVNFALNNKGGSSITATTSSGVLEGFNVGQIVINASHIGASIGVGDNAIFTLNNQDGSDITCGGFLVGQIVVIGESGQASLTTGDYATFNLNNTSGSFIQTSPLKGERPAQIVIDGDFGDGTFSVGDFANINLSNTDGSTIFGRYGASQLTIAGDGGTASFESGNNTGLTLTNSSSTILSNDGYQPYEDGSVGQILVDGFNFHGYYPGYGPSTFSSGDFATITVNNQNNGLIKTLTGDKAGQIVIDADQGGVAGFSVGNNATLTLNNETGSTIENGTYLTGQLVLDGWGEYINLGNHGAATFTALDYCTATLNNTTGGTIVGDSTAVGQIVVSGDNGTGSLVFGKHANLTLNNQQSSTIQNTSPPDGNFAGQLIVIGDGGTGTASFGTNANISLNNILGSIIEGNGKGAQLGIASKQGIGSFSVGDNSTLTLVNDATSTLISRLDVAQIVVFGNSSDNSTLHLGNNCAVSTTNSGTISNTDIGFVGQIVFDGSNGPVVLQTGTGSSITAINANGATITNISGQPIGQMIFRDATITSAGNGALTLTAINQNPSPGLVEGIIFNGSTTATPSNIVLQNASLVVNTPTSPFVISALTGDSPSVVKLSQNLEIDTLTGVTTTFDGVIRDAAGNNNLIIGGSGTQVLNGANTFGGNTIVNTGNLVLNGSVLHDMFVNNTAVLSGTGTVFGNLTINSGGTIKPGNSIGTFTVGGDYNHNSGGFYLVQINSWGQSSLIYVAGTANLFGGTVEVLPLSLPPVQIYRIVHANGGVKGRYDGLSLLAPIPGIQPQLCYDSNNVYLVFGDCNGGGGNSFSFPASTCNQVAVAQVLESITDPTADELLVLLSLQALQPAEAQHALSQMSGEQYTTLIATAEIAGEQFLRRLYDPLRSIVTTLPCCNTCCCAPTMDAWLEASGGQTFIDGNANVHGLKMNGYEISGGLQTALGCGWTVGAALSYAHDHVQYRIGGNGNNRTTLAGLYTLYRPEGYYFLGDVAFGYSQDSVKRPVHIGETFFQSHSSPKVYQGLLYGEMGIDVCFECMPSVLLQPFGGLEVGYYYRNHIREHHVNTLSLDIDKKSKTNCLTRLGIHLTTTQATCYSLSLDLAWQYLLSSIKNDVNAQFQSFGGPFEISGNILGRNSLDAAITYTRDISENFEFYVEASGQVWSRASSYDILGGLKYSW